MTANPSAHIPRLGPLPPPYSPETEALLRRMTPPEAPSLLILFRVLANHPQLAERCISLGGHFLGNNAALDLHEREVIIQRVCARCGAEYEWGVHVSAFAERAQLSSAEITALALGGHDDPRLAARDQLLAQLVDELHDHSGISDALWPRLTACWSDAQILESVMLAGWYRTVSYVCNVARIPLEAWAARW